MGVLRNLYRNWLLSKHCPRHWQFRGHTIDRRIFRHVVVYNEYSLPERYSSDDLIFDIGGHIGSFSLAVLRRGAGRVVVCEPDAENFALLARNLAPYGERARLLHCAAWRSDEAREVIGLCNPVCVRNTGAAQVTYGPASQCVQTVALDTLIDEWTQGGRRVSLLKLDCEGAEWPLLLTSRHLDRVDAICGEYHLLPQAEEFAVPGHGELTVELLVEQLAAQGFRVRTQPLGGDPFPTGLFFARRA